MYETCTLQGLLFLTSIRPGYGWDPGITRLILPRLGYHVDISQGARPRILYIVLRIGRTIQGSPHFNFQLLAVAQDHRRSGLAAELLGRALGWFREQGAGSVSVVTQGRNTGAVRLYERAGFVTYSIELWYHRWFDRASGGASSLR